jgi:DNA polymerase family B
MITIPHNTPVPEVITDEWKAERMKYVWKQGAFIGNYISERLPAELIFELEGVMHPALFLRKKGYACVLWENDTTPNEKMKIRGLCAIRQDWSKLTKRVSNEVLKLAVKNGEPDAAFRYLKEQMLLMRSGKLPVEDFIISKELHSMQPKNPSPHVEVCKRMIARDPASAPPLGTKITYVMCNDVRKEISFKSRIPDEVTSSQIDYNFYFDRQIIKPISEMLGPLLPGGQAALKRMMNNSHNRYKEIDTVFNVDTTVERRQSPSPPKQVVAVPTKKKQSTQTKVSDVFKSSPQTSSSTQGTKQGSKRAASDSTVRKTKKKKDGSILTMMKPK